MNIKRRFVVRATALAVAVIASTASAHGAGATAPLTTPAPTPSTQTPPTDQGQQQITESWALAPAGSDNPDVSGNRVDLSYVSDPGGTIQDAVTVFNFGNVPETFRVYATDAFDNDQGQFDALPRDKEPIDAGSWVTFSQESLTVPPGKQATMPITIKIPVDASPGDHAGAILAASETTGTDAGGNAVTLDRRTGTRMYIRVSGLLVAKLSVANVETTYDQAVNPLGGSAKVSYRIENRGNVRLSGKATLSVAGPFGIGEQKVTLPEVPELLPGGDVTLTVEVRDVAELLFGVTKVRVEPAELAGIDTLASEGTDNSFVPPLAVLLVLLAIVIGLLAWRGVRRRRLIQDGTSAATVGLHHQPDHEYERQNT